MKTLLKTRKNEIGATAIEYGLIAALIAVTIIASVKLVGTNLTSMFGTISTNIGNVNSAATNAVAGN